MQNKFNFSNAKKITKKNRTSSKSLKTKNENEIAKAANSNLKALSDYMNSSNPQANYLLI
jgi:hypothetical protein